MAMPNANVRDVDQRCRALVAALEASTLDDPFEDRVVADIIDEVRNLRVPGSTLQVLGGMVAFAQDRMNLLLLSRGAPQVTLDVIERAFAEDQVLDPELVRDCLAVVRELRRGRGEGLGEAISRTLRVWGPYSILTMALLYLREIRWLASTLDQSVGSVLQDLAITTEIDLGREQDNAPTSGPRSATHVADDEG